MDKDYSLVCFNIVGDGTNFDLDCLNLQAGIYSMVVSASDVTTVNTKNVKIEVANDRKSEVDLVIAPFSKNAEYEASTFNEYKKSYDDVMKNINSDTDEIFYQARK